MNDKTAIDKTAIDKTAIDKTAIDKTRRFLDQASRGWLRASADSSA
jgi:hypothetical protein